MRALVPVLALLAYAPLLFCACASAERAPGPITGPKPVLSTGLGQLRGVAYAGAVWIAPLPGKAELELARRRGIVTLLDLSSVAESSGRDLRGACRESSLEYVDARPANEDDPDDALVDRVLDEIARLAPHAVLLVSANATRAAMFFAIHRVLHDGVSLEQALVEARRCGMKAGSCESFVRRQVGRLTGRKL